MSYFNQEDQGNLGSFSLYETPELQDTSSPNQDMAYGAYAPIEFSDNLRGRPINDHGSSTLDQSPPSMTYPGSDQFSSMAYPGSSNQPCFSSLPSCSQSFDLPSSSGTSKKKKNREKKVKLYELGEQDDPREEARRQRAIKAFQDRNKQFQKEYDLEQQFESTREQRNELQLEKGNLQNNILLMERLKSLAESRTHLWGYGSPEDPYQE